VTDANSDLAGAQTSAAGTSTINITAVNDAPVLSGLGGTLAYTEQDAAAVIDSDVTLVDADDTQMSSATVSISAGFTAGDVLSFVNGGGITGNYDAGTGVLTLSGLASNAAYEAALESIKFNSTSDDPTATSASRTISWTVTDANSDLAGAQTSAAGTSTINITAVNDAPVLDLNTGTPGVNNTATFTEVSGPDTGANAVSFSTGGTNITDVDSVNLANLKVAISSASAATGDQVRFGATAINIATAGATGEVTAGGTVFSYAVADAGGMRTITFTSLTGSGGSASAGAKANYEILLDGLKYNNTSDTPVNGSTRTFNVIVNDGAANSSAANFTVTLAAVADGDTIAPFAQTPATITKAPTNDDRTVVLTFSEALAAGTFTAADLSVVGGSIASVTANGTNTQFTIVVTGVGNSGSGSHTLTVLANGYTDVAGNLGLASNPIAIGNPGNQSFPAGIAGSPIHLALADPSADMNDVVTVTFNNIPAGWTLNAGANNGDGTWTVQTTDPSSLMVTTPADFAGAAVLDINMSWTNADGSAGTAHILNNVEAYAPGSPIFAWWGDDHLTGSSGADTFVFAQPIGSDTIYSFDTAADRVDLIGYAGFTSFADVQAQMADDGNGDALLTLADGQSITFHGVHAASLSASNFAFDETPVTHNAGMMTIGDGAMLPLSGVVNNTGTIELNSTGSYTLLQLIQYGVTLEGGGNVTLSDSVDNVISGTLDSVTLTNVDNTISGAGQLGAGQLELVNEGTIVATGTNALIIDTGANTIVNSGTLEATGSGGLVINSAVDNSGLIWAHGGNVTINGAVSGSGSVQLDGMASFEFGAASSANVTLDAAATGTIVLHDSFDFSGAISGFNNDDLLDLADITFAVGTSASYIENQDGSGGTLMVTDGEHTANIALIGDYSADGFEISADNILGTLVKYHDQLV
jgi:hypothetical protein